MPQASQQATLATASVQGLVTIGNGVAGASVPAINASTGELLGTALASQQAPSYNGSSALPGTAPGTVAGPAALRAVAQAVTIASNTTGGANETMSTRFEAQKFNSGAFTSIAGIAISAQVDSSVATNASFTFAIRADSAGKPGAVLGSLSLVAPRSDLMNAGSFVGVYANFSTPLTVTTNTDLWLTADKNALAGGVTTLDSRVDTGTNVVATSPDGTTWTLAAGTKTLVYAVHAQSAYGLGAASIGQAGGVFSALYQPGIIASSMVAQGVLGQSSRNAGGQFTSVYSSGAVGTSTWGNGLAGTTTAGIGINANISGTLLASTSNAGLQVLRTTARAGFNHTGAALFVNDAATGSGSTTGAVIQLQVSGADVWNQAQAGAATLTNTDAGTSNPTVLYTIIHKSSGAPAAGFGASMLFRAHSANNTIRDLCQVGGQWTVATDGSQTSQMNFSVVNAGGALAGAMSIIPGGISIPTAIGSDASTNNQLLTLTVYHKTSGTPIASFGTQMLFAADDSAAAKVTQAAIQTLWIVATDGAQTARQTFSIYDTAARECIRLQASGTAPMLGFYGSAATAKQAVTGSRGANAALASLLTALATLGLITDSSS